MSQSGLLEITHEKLYWPSPDQVLTPTGIGPSIYAQLAQEKLGKTIERECQDGVGVRVGILTINPEGDETDAPLAVVCVFNRPISQVTLSKTYNLAWSFSRTQALITIEPHLLRVWTCCEEPPDKPEALEPVAEVSRENLVSLSDSSLSQQAAESLYWVELVSGHFFQKNENRFQKSRAADQMLLSNLKSVRRQLKELHLNEDIIHDLLARLIFIQFLFQRKDSSGKPALDESFLRHLYKKKTLSAVYRDLPEILTNHTDTYKFFRLLNEKFNGDLFPGRGATTAEREQEWQTEEKQVTQTHLNKLAEFVSGELEMDDGQQCLWPLYSFDAVPLDFISSIYEEFTSKQKGTGAHYTPGHIVDFILDGVLPWNGQEWNLKILDPACGSGIFLVKAFQRLIHRWKNAHPGEEIKSKTLKSILEHNIFGVDIDSHAVRVASFSLYLTMCDEIDPRHYWKTVDFPRLRERNLIDKDFFGEDIEGIRTIEDASKYDFVIGNAPWGQNRATPLAKQWAKTYQWKITYGNIGPLFLPKATALTKSGGRVAMMQPSGALIFNQKSTARDFRDKLFSRFKIEEIVNLSALAFGLFKDSLSPSRIVTMRPDPPDGKPLYYICPKPTRATEDDYRILIEPQDISVIYPQEAATTPLVWTALMWGGRRDLALVRRLSQQENLEKLKSRDIVTSREGIIRGDRRKYQKFIVGKRILESAKFPDNTLLFLQSVNFPINEDPYTHFRDSTNFAAFELPQMILKQSWRQEVGRFQAAIIVSNAEGIICSQSYVSVHVPEEYKSVLEAACLSYNSKLGVYYLLLSSGRFASYRAETNVGDLLRLPIPEYEPNMLQGIETLNDVDWRIRQAFNLKESEWVLIEDLFDYTLPDFKGDNCSPGRQRTNRKDNKENIEPELSAYCEYFMRVIKAGFGLDKQICATIFQEKTSPYIPVRLVAFYLNQPVHEGRKIEAIDSPELLRLLDELNKSFIDQGHKNGIFYQRTARIYTSSQIQGQTVPTIYFVKPDKIRYWTRSMALRDADEVAADIMLWRHSPEKGANTGAES